ncbi:MAG: metalloregulator ArsR/SmtB family transcription factor [Pseudomonadota bacterium]
MIDHVDMTDSSAAAAFAALGSASRVALLRLLVRAGTDGMNVSQLREAIGTPATTLTHHLGKLVEAGLVTQQRRGRELRCRADYPVIRAIGAFLMEDCCAGVFDARGEVCCSATTD